MTDVIVRGWEMPYTCIERPFRIREEWDMEYGIKVPMFACRFALHESIEGDEDADPWIDVRKIVKEGYSHRIYDNCPLEEVEEYKN